MSYREDATIDVNALDIEWLQLPKIEERYIARSKTLKLKVTDATEELKLAEEEVKTIRSTLLQKVHSNPELYLQKKNCTGPEAEAFYRTHKKYKRVKKECIQAEIALLNAKDAATTASDMKDLIHFTKTKALEKLTELHGQEYFAGPKVPRDINREIERREVKEKRQKEKSKKIGKGLRRKKK